MKFRNQARLCLAISDFEAQIKLSICLDLDYHDQGRNQNWGGLKMEIFCDVILMT